MTEKPDLPDIADIRSEIDRVDTALLSLIAERLDLAGAVRKAKSGARVWRPSREQSHIRDLADAAGDTPAHLVSRIWAELMSASLALQGPMRLHVALEGDALDVWTLVRDRFGAALPALSYPTTSSALAAAYAEDEGVAVLPAPGGMNSWWGALCPDGAMPDMKILAGLPRVGGQQWPRAVAVSNIDLQPSGSDMSLIALSEPSALQKAGLTGVLRAEAGPKSLMSVDGFIGPNDEAFTALKSHDPSAAIIGALAGPLNDTSA
jgi:chorismate mutase